jgi:hypothetical protein
MYSALDVRGEPYQEIFLFGQLFMVISGDGAKMVRG